MSSSYFLRAISLIFILLYLSDNTSTLPDKNESVTQKLIQDICSKTRNPSLCANNLNPLKGTRLLHRPLSVLATNLISTAKSNAERTVTLFQERLHGMPKAKLELKKKYKNCGKSYTNVMKQLKTIKTYLTREDMDHVKRYTMMAAGQVRSCDVVLAGPPWIELEANIKLLQANREFKDLCEIVVNICNFLIY
ncbi:Unknown protein [Striga hermonthica]|uniref:Pectinesterase inhibitor domain-containing protein n=1 Tax=Striga hermonthica TaxID=68872 RepID=A0A9N7RNN7_STRHE|nr:Unknown protein [Striga hermonthica]